MALKDMLTPDDQDKLRLVLNDDEVYQAVYQEVFDYRMAAESLISYAGDPAKSGTEELAKSLRDALNDFRSQEEAFLNEAYSIVWPQQATPDAEQQVQMQAAKVSAPPSPAVNWNDTWK